MGPVQIVATILATAIMDRHDLLWSVLLAPLLDQINCAG